MSKREESYSLAELPFRHISELLEIGLRKIARCSADIEGEHGRTSMGVRERDVDTFLESLQQKVDEDGVYERKDMRTFVEWLNRAAMGY